MTEQQATCTVCGYDPANHRKEAHQFRPASPATPTAAGQGMPARIQLEDGSMAMPWQAQEAGLWQPPAEVQQDDERSVLRAAHELMASQFRTMRREKEHGWREAERWQDRAEAAEEKLAADTDWSPGRWWRVVSPDGSLWAETSDERDARTRVRPGDTLQQQYQLLRQEWRDVDLTDATDRARAALGAR